MTQKQIDTLNDLGFKVDEGEGYYFRVFKTVDFGIMEVYIDEGVITTAVGASTILKSHPFTLTKLREIVSKLEKL